MSTQELYRTTASPDAKSLEERDMREKAMHIIEGLTNAARRLEEEKHVALRYDAFLPEFLNKMGIMEELEERVAQGKPFLVVALDLDNFSDVNTELGHPGGDVVLKSVGGYLNEVLRRGTDTVLGRVGGDEFVAIVDLAEDNDDYEDNERRNSNPTEQMEGALERIKRAEELFRNDYSNLVERGIKIGISAGVVMFDPADPMNESVDGATLYKRADEKLYEAKHHVHKDD
jgi:diguanylate cyclase (GGDEF)-like protein